MDGGLKIPVTHWR